MAHPQLDNLVRIGQLKAEPPSGAQIQGLLRSGLRRLDDAEREELGLESRFDLAYNAHALSQEALRAAAQQEHRSSANMAEALSRDDCGKNGMKSVPLRLSQRTAGPRTSDPDLGRNRVSPQASILGLTLRDEFRGPRLMDATIKLTNEDNTGAVRITWESQS